MLIVFGLRARRPQRRWKPFPIAENMNLTFLGMAMIGLVGYLLDATFGQAQRRVLWWKGAARL